MKKINYIISYILIFAFSVNNTFGQADIKSKIADNRKIALAWIETLNKHDTITLTSFYDDKVQVESPNWEGIKTGKEVVRNTYSRYFASTPDLEHELQNIIATDSAIVIEYRSFGTLSHPEQNTPDYMRGKKYTLQNCTRMDIRNGKITRQATYFDQVAFLKQMGFFERQ